MKTHKKDTGHSLAELDSEMATLGEHLLRRAAGARVSPVSREIRENLLGSWRALRVARRCDCGEPACRSYAFDRSEENLCERNRPQTIAGELAIVADRAGRVIRVEALAFDNCAPARARAYIADGDDWRVVTLAA